MIKVLYLIITFAISLILGYSFFIGFALIVRPPFGNSEVETFKNMHDFVITNGLKNFLISLIIGIIVLFIGIIVLFIGQLFIFKKLKFSFLIMIIFLFFSNIGNLLGIQNYFNGLQSEFKYHQFNK